MIQTKQPIRDVEEFQGAWLKARERFGTLLEAETIKKLAARGFQEFGRGVICLAFRRGQPCYFYLPSDRLLSVVNKLERLLPLLSRLKTYQPEKSEIIVLVTFSDLEIEQISPYQYFYLSVS